MWSEFTSSSYQWYLDGSILDDINWTGETGQEVYLTDTAMGLDFYGDYSCLTDSGYTRTVHVVLNTLEVPTITYFENDGIMTQLEWSIIPTCSGYEVLAS
ncbi:MAG: hypothetical protein KAS62_08850, partial [Candidatus Delongbacteria bacterium]|nr:hypothetical protein [Candidatus Delongbacteria bacterium]